MLKFFFFFFILSLLVGNILQVLLLLKANFYVIKKFNSSAIFKLRVSNTIS